MGSPDYQEYCRTLKALMLAPPPLLAACSHYRPRPGWEVPGCSSCGIIDDPVPCPELMRRFGVPLPCLRDLEAIVSASYGGTE